MGRGGSPILRGKNEAEAARKFGKQRVRRAEMVKMINLAIRRYDRRRLHRRALRYLEEMVAPIVNRFRGRTSIGED